MSEERLEIIEKLAHKEGDELLIEVCQEVRRLQARVSKLQQERYTWASLDSPYRGKLYAG